MVLFLTSSPCVEGKGDINPANGFRELLKKEVKRKAKGVFITATPDNQELTDWAAYSMKQNMEDAGLSFASYYVIDRRTQHCASRLIKESEFIILGGGHVPTQNKFFKEIGLKELLKNYDGVVMGISAGTMNCAEIVYAEPEEPGEAVDTNYKRFISGLALTQRQVLPHFQKAFNTKVDNMRLIEDIAFEDSEENEFWGLPDGSFIFANDTKEELHGEAYLITNKTITKINEKEQTFSFCPQP